MEAAERARDMAKKQKEIQRETLDDAIKAERALLTGPVKLVHEIEEKARKASVFVDAKGIVRYFGHPGALNEQRLKELLAKFVQ